MGAAGFGHDEPPLIDVVAEGLLGLGGELGGLVPVEVEDRCLQEILHGGGGRVDDLPRQQVLPVPRLPSGTCPFGHGLALSRLRRHLIQKNVVLHPIAQCGSILQTFRNTLVHRKQN
jgi:hypothetical protein